MRQLVIGLHKFNFHKIYRDEVQPSIKKGASEDIKKQVNVTAQSGGSVTGGGSYTISEYAKVTAEPETNYTFAGWYENNILISKYFSPV